jgi:multidrug transporter EmrE-like cation transporter
MGGMSFWGPLLLTIGGGVLYHVAVKSVPRGIDSALVLVVAYAAALSASLAAYLLLPSVAAGEPASRPWHPAVIGLGLAAVAIELGYLLMYRMAWPVSIASLVVNGTVALLLVPVGINMFGERFSATHGVGMLLCFAGLTLLRR